MDLPIPPEPVFDESMDELQCRVEKMVRKVPAVRNFDKAFGDVARVLKHDDERRTSQWSFDKPLYERGMERRRLLLINSLFLGFSATGCRASMSTSKWRTSDPHSRAVCVDVGQQHVYFTLEPSSQVGRRGVASRDANESLRLALGLPRHTDVPSRSWQDSAELKLEERLREIVVAIIVEAETIYRASAVRHREWIIERKEAVTNRIAQEEAERIKQEREAEERRRQAQVDGLLKQAADLQKAETIRGFVFKIRSRMPPVSVDQLENWCAWALAQADRLDPSLTLKFVEQTVTAAA
jgi:hypothetical protein